jgi:uncharacterized protein
MENFFLFIFRFFRQHRTSFWLLLATMMALFTWRAFSVELEEDVTKIFPDDERVAKLDYVFRNSKLAERIVVMISVRDSTSRPQPDQLTEVATLLETSIREKLANRIKGVRSQVDDQQVLDLFDLIHEHLPVFLDEHDYARLDSMVQPDAARAILNSNYRQLISPAGIVTHKIIVKDPMGISFLPMKKLQQLQVDDNFELYNNFIVTRDYRHLVLFVEPVYAPNDTGNNSKLLDELNRISETITGDFPELMVSYFGTSVVAAGNARQLQQDTRVTISLTVVLLMVVLLGFFRKKRIPFIMLVPVVFGALFALTCISFFKVTLSILAIAVGSIILGVAVDYSLHYLVLLKDMQDSEKVLREVVKPLTIGSFTTVFAFFCLQLTSASVLNDIGLFAGLSLVGAAFCSLTVLPQLVEPEVLDVRTPPWFARMTSYSFESRKPLVYVILILTPVFFYLAGKVEFNKDMNRLNFMTDETRESEKRLEAINKASLSSIYVVSSGADLQAALRRNEINTAMLDSLKDTGLVHKVSSVSTFLISDSLQQKRIAQWKTFWTPEKTDALRQTIRAEGAKLHFSPLLFANSDSLLSREYRILESNEIQSLRSAFFDDYIIEKDTSATIITLANVPAGNRNAVYAALEGTPSERFDRQMLTSLFVEYVNADFSFIVTVTSVLVFVALLVTLGRIELTLITFIPMFFSWIWILGIMALVGIEFNIVNVMVSTFIFGLGDDYSIFIMDGLQQEYRAGRKVLGSIKTSVYLSAFTTICGLGVLIFAGHPALKSIAGISIIGIACVFLMAQTLEPYFFRLLISNRARDGYTPITVRGVLLTIYTYGFFVLGSFFLTIVGLLLKVLPLPRRRVRYLFHWLICRFTNLNVKGAFNLKRRVINRTAGTFDRPSVIIANHSSFLDILWMTMQHPRVILLTNKWVWNSPVFGGVVRLAGYYPVTEGAEDSVDRLRKMTDEGYSIVVFPEGTRSLDGKIKRFHKGAFYLAESLNLPILPVLIHGANTAIRKGEIYLNDSTITTKYLPPIEPGDNSFGNTYSERAKLVGKYFREEHARLALEQESPAFYHDRLISNYIYKGPVLEWYARIKVRLEGDYETFHKLIPQKAVILDLGCGYGFMDYMLQFLSEERVITGVDYDEAKIETAQHGYLRSNRLNFVHGDVMTIPMDRYDAIIIADVLHYLTAEEQDVLVERCISHLNPGGRLIIRDGNRDLQERHKGTWLTEFFSVKLFGFNKSRNKLNFISGEHLKALVNGRGLTFSVQDETRFTSNVIFVIGKPLSVHESV